MDLEEWEFLSEEGLIDQLSPRDRRSRRNQKDTSSSAVMGGGKRVVLYPNSSSIDSQYLERFIGEDPHSENNDEMMNKNKDEVVRPLTPVKFHHPEIMSAPAPVIVDGDKESMEVVKEVISGENNKVGAGGGGVVVVGSQEEEEPVSQVFFKKTTNEFADMKLLESPKGKSNWGLGFVPQIMDPLFTEKTIGFESDEDDDSSNSYTMERRKRKACDGEEEEELADENNNKSSSSSDDEEKKEGGGLRVWKMGMMSGIGALCSFGVAACATIIVMACRKEKQHHKLHFHFYTDDNNKVGDHAAKLNDVISAVRRGAAAAPTSNRAEITVGGYFQGL